ncbi:CCC motif membrane protein [Flavobacteriaceae sp. LMIT009]|jgi:hypothetical protein
MERKRLDTTLIYILSVLGFLCCCIGGIGFILAGVAFLVANNKLKEAYQNPENFENIEGMKTAKIVALVVLIINILYLARTIYVISTVGWDELMEQSQMMMEQFE